MIGKTAAIVLTAAVSTFWAPLGAFSEANAQSKSYTFELRNDCRKTNSGGCTAKGEKCANAPAGHYFTPQRVSGVVTGSLSPGHEPLCRTAETTGKGVVVNGLLAPTSMCASPHAESGSGMGGLNQVYYVKCSYTTTIYPLPN
ncbi:MAG: hypothetical protein GY751_23980 [Bacteroidetes bacterium]|nr:hypothetical protein [Bacteroidota bacterium]